MYYRIIKIDLNEYAVFILILSLKYSMDTTSNGNKTQGPEIEEVVFVKSGKPGSSVGASKKQPDKEKSHKSKNIHLSEIKSIIHDMFTNWEISNSELSIDKYFKEFCECIRETYLAYISPKKIKKMYEDDLLEVIETEIINRIQNEEVVKSEDHIQRNIGIIDFLNTIEAPAQRSPGWYAFRNNRITASDFAIALDKNPYSKREDLILGKCGRGKPFTPGAAILHGVKYEDVAVNIYENRNNVKIAEYGCIPHPKYDFIGASPDGICSYESENRQFIGRMLEIKCPKSRVLNGQVPEYYFCQVQGQLEVCDLPECDFLECKIVEYSGVDEFLADSLEVSHSGMAVENEVDDYSIVDVFTRPNGFEKGVVIEIYDHDLEKTIFRYFNKNSKPFVTIEEVKEWEDKTIGWILNDDRYDYLATCYWKLCEYSCILVKRDREFWEMLLAGLSKLWDSILYYRREGIELLIKEIEDRKAKAKLEKEKKGGGKGKDTGFKPGKEYNIAFLPDTDDEGDSGSGGEKKIVSIEDKVSQILKDI